MVNNNDDDHKKTVSKYRKTVLEENVVLYFLIKAWEECKKRKETIKNVFELYELDKQIDDILMAIKTTNKRISKLIFDWGTLSGSLFQRLFDKSNKTKEYLLFMDDNNRIREVCNSVFSLFEETPDLLDKINVREFITYLGKFFEKSEEFTSPKEYLNNLIK